MLSSLAIAYLFVGGSGAGALFASQLIDALWAKAPVSMICSLGVTEQRPIDRVLSLSTLFGTVAVFFGVACLLFDLGRVDRALSLLFSPTPSLMSLGAFSLAALCVCGFVLSTLRCAYLPGVPLFLVCVFRVVTIVVSAVVMTYTGLLLMSVEGVAFWNTAFVPVLFVASSVSCGLALVLVAAALAERDEQALWLLRRIALCDALVVVVELLVAVLFVFVSLSSDHPARFASAVSLIEDRGILWWGGFFACGLVVPLIVEGAAISRMLEPSWERGAFPRTGIMLLVAAAVLVGGASMRASVVESGQHRVLELQAAEAAGDFGGVDRATSSKPLALGLGEDGLMKGMGGSS